MTTRVSASHGRVAIVEQDELTVTSTYWRQLYSYLSRQRRKSRRARLAEIVERQFRKSLPKAKARPIRVYGSAPRRPSSALN